MLQLTCCFAVLKLCLERQNIAKTLPSHRSSFSVESGRVQLSCHAVL